MGFSRSGLVDQLIFDGYTPQQAEAGVSALSVDYSQEAVESGQSYLDLSPMSRSSLIDQLVFDGYTGQQAAAAADQLGL